MKRSFTKTYLHITLITGMLAIFAYALNLVLPYLSDFLEGFMVSFGLVLVLFSLILQRSKKFMKKIEVAEGDERLVMIKQKTLSAGYYFTMVTNVIAVIVFGAFESTYYVSFALACMMLLNAAFIQLMNIYYKRKY